MRKLRKRHLCLQGIHPLTADTLPTYVYTDTHAHTHTHPYITIKNNVVSALMKPEKSAMEKELDS